MVPTKNKQITELPFFGKEYVVEFDLFINSIKQHDSVIRIGLGGNADAYGDRNPAIYVNKQPQELHLASSINLSL